MQISAELAHAIFHCNDQRKQSNAF